MAKYNNPRFLRSVNQGGPLVRSFLEADSQTFKAGQLVYLDSDGTHLTVCADAANVVLGMAQKDATNVSTGNIYIPVVIIRPQDEIEIDVYQGGADDGAAETQLLQNFALDVTLNECTIDLNVTNDDLMTLQEIVDADGKTVVVTFLESCLQYSVGY
jgi:hypothetical protein